MRAAIEASPDIASEPSTRTASPIAEFLIVGGATLLLFPISWWLRAWIGLDAAELAVGFLFFHAAHVLNDPHFSVTYFLFYEDVRRRVLGPDIPLAQRIRYVLAGFVAPIVLVSWAGGAIALGSAQALGWMVQLMFLLVGWHYVKQAFGVLTVLSARRGVRFTTVERRVVLAHCYAAWAFAWSNPATKAGEFVEKGVIYWAIERPRALEIGAGIALALSTVALVVILVSRWRREGAWMPPPPLVTFLITVWVWTIGSRVDPLLQYAIPALHSIQYFYFVWLLKRNQARAYEGPPHFERPVGARLAMLALSALALGWLLFHGAPSVLDGALVDAGSGDRLGATPFFAAFYVVVNIHHFVMDYVIWRRENPATRWLHDDARA